MVPIALVSSVAALPTSICPQAMSYFRPSRAVDFVSPVTACFVAVYGAEFGRGDLAEMELMNQTVTWLPGQIPEEDLAGLLASVGIAQRLWNAEPGDLAGVRRLGRLEAIAAQHQRQT